MSESKQKVSAAAAGEAANKWEEVMKLAEKYGFIARAYGGVAMLMCHEVQKEEGIFEEIQRMNGRKT